jgi:phage shock protein PspC (stress-responsive transcriptional regulator)
MPLGRLVPHRGGIPSSYRIRQELTMSREAAAMTTQTDTTYRRLLRSRTDRKVVGVCGGLGEYFDVDPTLVRIAVVLGSLFTGGTLVIAYLAAALFIPES